MHKEKEKHQTSQTFANNNNNSNNDNNNNNNNNSGNNNIMIMIMINRKVKKKTYPNAEFGYVFSFHIQRNNAQEQQQVLKCLALNLNAVIHPNIEQLACMVKLSLSKDCCISTETFLFS